MGVVELSAVEELDSLQEQPPALLGSQIGVQLSMSAGHARESVKPNPKSKI
jgi:hypothetical protein